MCCLTFRIDPTLGIRLGLVRDRILDAACKVFQQRGMQGASVREIVDVAHTNKVSFYRHLASKDALIAEILALRNRSRGCRRRDRHVGECIEWRAIPDSRE